MQRFFPFGPVGQEWTKMILTLLSVFLDFYVFPLRYTLTLISHQCSFLIPGPRKVATYTRAAFPILYRKALS